MKKSHTFASDSINQTNKQTSVMEKLNGFKASVWCVFTMFVLLLGWLIYYDNPYLNVVVIPIAAMAVLLLVSWLQETKFKVRGRFFTWFFNGNK